jgi:dCMP deaminase
MDKRPSWDEYFMSISRLVAGRSTCLRRHVGAVLVRDRHILATGYNGPPAGLPHCDETGCIREKLGVPTGERHELCRGIHAEQNAIIQSANYGTGIRGATIYTTLHPCSVDQLPDLVGAPVGDDSAPVATGNPTPETGTG